MIPNLSIGRRVKIISTEIDHHGEQGIVLALRSERLELSAHQQHSRDDVLDRILRSTIATVSLDNGISANVPANFLCILD
mgnify:CR=1 FL=1